MKPVSDKKKKRISEKNKEYQNMNFVLFTKKKEYLQKRYKVYLTKKKNICKIIKPLSDKKKKENICKKDKRISDEIKKKRISVKKISEYLIMTGISAKR